MTDDSLYRREVLRLAADAMGAGHLPAPDAAATAHNPACGDRVTVELAMDRGRVTALAHATQACVLTQASAAMLAPRRWAKLVPGWRRWLRKSAPSSREEPPPEGYGVFDGVAAHTGRHICVLLPLEAALKRARECRERR